MSHTTHVWILILKIAMTAIFSCTWPQTVAPKGHTHMALFSRKDTWMNLLALKLLHLRVHINTNDSNFLLYRGPDSSPKGPYAPWLIYSAEQIHEWTFLHWNYYMLEFTKTPMTATFSCTWAQTVAPKGHMSPNWFIQPNRYMNEPFCIETITRWSSQKHQWQQLSPVPCVQGPRQ